MQQGRDHLSSGLWPSWQAVDHHQHVRYAYLNSKWKMLKLDQSWQLAYGMWLTAADGTATGDELAFLCQRDLQSKMMSFSAAVSEFLYPSADQVVRQPKLECCSQMRWGCRFPVAQSGEFQWHRVGFPGSVAAWRQMESPERGGWGCGMTSDGISRARWMGWMLLLFMFTGGARCMLGSGWPAEIPQPCVGGRVTFVLSCLVLSCLVLSCLVLSCLVLSCLDTCSKLFSSIWHGRDLARCAISPVGS